MHNSSEQPERDAAAAVYYMLASHKRCGPRALPYERGTLDVLAENTALTSRMSHRGVQSSEHLNDNNCMSGTRRRSMELQSGEW